MKKLLSLVLVLALASLANAMILQISVGGDPDPIDSEITLLPSQEIILDITSPDGFGQGEYVYFGLVTNHLGSISGGVVVMPPAPDASGILFWEDIGAFFEPYGLGIVGNVDTFQTATGYHAAPGVYFDGIIFHCEGIGDAVVQLVSTMDFETFTVEDTVIIHQIPEPATIALLSLGGLLLRRKK